MTNLLQTFEKKQIEKLISKKRIPAFRSGDVLKVTVKIIEYGTGSAPTSNSGAINEAVSNVSSSIETSRESVIHL